MLSEFSVPLRTRFAVEMACMRISKGKVYAGTSVTIFNRRLLHTDRKCAVGDIGDR